MSSLRFLPTVPATLLGPLTEALARLGRPAPREILALRRPGALGCYAFTDDQGSPWRLTVALQDQVGSGVFGPLVAARALEGDLELPVPEPVIALPLSALGCPALVHGMPRGRPADARNEPELALRALGRVIDALGRRPQPWRGVGATPWRFVPTAGSWGAEYAALCARWAALASRGGTLLQPMGSFLLAMIDPAALTLEGPAVLVPGGLAPGALWMDDRGALTAVDGWMPAWSGDPWSAWAPVLHLSAGALATLRGAFVHPPALSPQRARLQIYAAGHVLLMLAEAAAAPGPLERVHALQRALLAWEALPSLAERLAAADEGREHAAPRGVERASVLAALDRMAREPGLTDPEPWMAVAGAALLAHRVGGEPALAGWREVAKESSALLEPGLGAAPTGPEHALNLESPRAWILRWLAAELREAAGGQAPEGLDAAVARLGWLPRAGGGSAPARLLEATLGLAAVARLGGEGAEQMRALLIAQARESWSELDFGVPAPEVPPGRYLLHYAATAAHADQAQPVGLLLYAFARVGALPLPASPPAILRALGVPSP